MRSSTEPAEPPDDLPSGVVAIVDDDEQISRALGTWLELRGFETVHHLSAESLLQALKQGGGAMNLSAGPGGCTMRRLLGAVLDVNLPGIDGIELARQLRRQAPALPMALITALRDEERRPYGEVPSGIRCLKKPFDLEALEDALFPLLN